WHGYGFLPGYRPPEQIEWELNHRTRNWYGAPIYWYGGPGYYRGRWNGGGFGPCWTPTPIGTFWNCGEAHIPEKRALISGLPDISSLKCASRKQPPCDIGFTRYQLIKVRKSETSDLRYRVYPISAH